MEGKVYIYEKTLCMGGNYYWYMAYSVSLVYWLYETLPKWHDSLAGLIIIILGSIFVLSKAKPTPNWPHIINIILGLWLIVVGIIMFGQTSTAARWNEIIVGILVALVSAIATQIIEGKKAFIYTKEGGVLVEMTRMTYKEGIIEMKGKAFGSMPQTMHVRPEEIWSMLGLAPFEVITHLPKMLYVGWKRSKEANIEK